MNFFFCIIEQWRMKERERSRESSLWNLFFAQRNIILLTLNSLMPLSNINIKMKNRKEKKLILISHMP